LINILQLLLRTLPFKSTTGKVFSSNEQDNNREVKTFPILFSLLILAIREIHPSLNIGCFIQKPVRVEYLVKRVTAELE
jgi:hypothetical protein